MSTTQPRRDFIVKSDHDDLGEDTFHDWYFPGKRINADRAGRVRQDSIGWGQWWRVECNNMRCDAWGILRTEAIMALTEAAR